MVEGIRAVAFDIDGTIYPTHRFYLKVWPYYLKNLKFFINFGKVRKELHRRAASLTRLDSSQKKDPAKSFYNEQSQLLAKKMHVSPEEAGRMIEDICYKGLVKYYTSVEPYADALKVIYEIKASGLKVAILSDFPPEQKGDIWGIKQYCDVILGTEALGALKPDPYSFKKMADLLGVAPEKILFVGNSRKYDVTGSKAAGMKSAYLLAWRYRIFKFLKVKNADVTFSKYRQLQDFVLK